MLSLPRAAVSTSFTKNQTNDEVGIRGSERLTYFLGVEKKLLAPEITTSPFSYGYTSVHKTLFFLTV